MTTIKRRLLQYTQELAVDATAWTQNGILISGSKRKSMHIYCWLANVTTCRQGSLALSPARRLEKTSEEKSHPLPRHSTNPEKAPQLAQKRPSPAPSESLQTLYSFAP